MVIETEVFASHKSNPEYNLLASSTLAIETPEFPTLPQISGRRSGSLPYRVTLSKAVDNLT
ncbi:MAG: Uncharacterised protein [Methanobacteriota archaeon]|nr:MAG: Uncharacterised protein [Euryarchaeota archaeon]